MRDEIENRVASIARAVVKAESLEERADRLAATAVRAYADAKAARQRAELLRSQTRARLC
ncbi:hypothetical protein DMA12_43815 [Amycolatopsis balhimycina DSM 5908]|uniref:Uncharacterized protein n=1 Tax=Amycolatopsis balhimycina DSM 5908 TaxID=1081091 RepID=A0A428VXJ9_AMYBA|nr:hypothetical protein [Amycolatopsis balhimycina]RSM35556.1 hypothetical protein DMA12_43815 [Amycolatopsis balhimycina DSM 5908]